MRFWNLTEKRRETWAAWLFLLPSMIGMLVFVIGPAVSSLVLSFFEWDMISAPSFVGVENAKELTNDSLFRRSLVNTLYYTIVSVPLSIVCSLLLALIVHRGLRGMAFFRTVYFLPVVSSAVAIALVWRWIYNADYGIVNILLRGVGLPGPDWLGSTEWSMPAVILMSVWKEVGYLMVLFLAGLQSLPKEIYESVSLDGATPWQRFRSITLPLLSPTTFFVLIVQLISAFQIFTEAYIMTEGGPADSTLTVVYYLYNQGFRYFSMGYASAIAWVLFLIILLVTLFQWYVTQRKVFYN